jgi:hypothetical protein
MGAQRGWSATRLERNAAGAQRGWSATRLERNAAGAQRGWSATRWARNAVRARRDGSTMVSQAEHTAEDKAQRAGPPLPLRARALNRRS